MKYTKSYTTTLRPAIPAPYVESFVTGQIPLFSFDLEQRPDGEIWFIPASTRPWGIYDPLKQLRNSAVKADVLTPYLEFARLDPNSQNDLLMYANTHGIPTSRVYNGLNSAALDRQFQDGSMTPAPYPIKKFRHEINKMGLFLELKAIVAGDLSPDRARRFDEIVQLYKRERAERFFALLDEPSYKPTRKSIMDFDRKELATLVFGIINRELKGVALTINVRLRQDPVFERSFLPASLLQALYATLVEDIASPIKKCADPKCGNLFHGTYKGKDYCSHDCALKKAKRDFYHRKREVVLLYREGVSINEISNQLKLDRKKIQGWIKNEEAEHGAKKR